MTAMLSPTAQRGDTCTSCGGSGLDGDYACPHCHGEGVYQVSRRIVRNTARAVRPATPARPPLDVAGSPEEVALRARLVRRGWRISARPGQCVLCGNGFHPPQAIKFVKTDSPRFQYRADCCPGDDRA